MMISRPAEQDYHRGSASRLFECQLDIAVVETDDFETVRENFISKSSKALGPQTLRDEVLQDGLHGGTAICRHVRAEIRNQRLGHPPAHLDDFRVLQVQLVPLARGHLGILLRTSFLAAF